MLIFLTISLINVAYQHHLWREFWVSEFALVVSALVACYLLRRKEL